MFSSSTQENNHFEHHFEWRTVIVVAVHENAVGSADQFVGDGLVEQSRVTLDVVMRQSGIFVDRVQLEGPVIREAEHVAQRLVVRVVDEDCRQMRRTIYVCIEVAAEQQFESNNCVQHLLVRMASGMVPNMTA